MTGRTPASSFTRRTFLSAIAAAISTRAAVASQAPRVAVIDWALLETCLALGIVPLAASELVQYRKLVVEPEAPATVNDLGLRGTPNFEMLRLVKPDLILISQFYSYQRAQLERVAPVLDLPVHQAGTPPYALLESSTLKLGEALGHRTGAQAYVETTADALARARSSLASGRTRPVFVISLGDSRHFRAFGGDSMFGDVLAQLGLQNAWTDTTSYSAAAPVGIEALARAPEAGIVIVEPAPPETARTLPRNAVWNALPAVIENRVSTIAPVNHFGGLPSARRFARLLQTAVGNWPAA
ncbi:MAG: ABC transporter substrate-binding protein [Aquamicrobium sp.]|nr:ABC transporter substrate-binding protein [Aquamicrobium sp.]